MPKKDGDAPKERAASTASLASAHAAFSPAAEVARDLLARAEERAVGTELTAFDLLEREARSDLEAAEYPGPDCLLPTELEGLTGGDRLSTARLAHLRECVSCAALFRASQAPEAVFQAIRDELAQLDDGVEASELVSVAAYAEGVAAGPSELVGTSIAAAKAPPRRFWRFLIPASAAAMAAAAAVVFILTSVVSPKNFSDGEPGIAAGSESEDFLLRARLHELLATSGTPVATAGGESDLVVYLSSDNLQPRLVDVMLVGRPPGGGGSGIEEAQELWRGSFEIDSSAERQRVASRVFAQIREECGAGPVPGDTPVLDGSACSDRQVAILASRF